jgi:AcrR family transcriptional regulator
MDAVGTVVGARRRVHDAIRGDILAVARNQMATQGAATLSLRAVARELGMVSSAIYRYFPSRDELLTALIVDGYDAMGEVAERAAASAKGGPAATFRVVCHAVRTWALEHPQEYALLYGSPVPGYEAPGFTVGPASRVPSVLARVVVELNESGELAEPEGAPLSKGMAAEARAIRDAVMPGVALPIVARALAVWVLLFGQLNFEVFGRFDMKSSNPEAMFDYVIALMGSIVGIPRRPAAQG